MSRRHAEAIKVCSCVLPSGRNALRYSGGALVQRRRVVCVIQLLVHELVNQAVGLLLELSKRDAPEPFFQRVKPVEDCIGHKRDCDNYKYD